MGVFNCSDLIPLTEEYLLEHGFHRHTSTIVLGDPIVWYTYRMGRNDVVSISLSQNFMQYRSGFDKPWVRHTLVDQVSFNLIMNQVQISCKQYEEFR